MNRDMAALVHEGTRVWWPGICGPVTFGTARKVRG